MHRLRSLIDPATTAVVTIELQEGVVGHQALLPELAQRVAEANTIEAAAKVCRAARSVGARVVHCTVEHRVDGAGLIENAKITALIGKYRREQGNLPTQVGAPGAGLVAELGPEPVDIVLPRLHGMTPFMCTSLDQMLRNIGTKTVVATGVSVNIGVLGFCLNALDLGYQVIVVRDAVAGVPAQYADAVIDNTLSLIATITTSTELCSLWESGA